LIVEVSDEALEDLTRLRRWLGERHPAAAIRAAVALGTAFKSLRRFPDRGALLGGGLRERHVKFGRYGYVVHYEVLGDQVIVTRVFHALEAR